MKTKHTHLAALACASHIGTSALSQAATIAWNFDTPSLEGWVALTGTTQYGVITNGESPFQSGVSYLGDISGNSDADPDDLNIMSSPTIQFDLTSGLTAYLRKGHANTALNQTLGVVSGTTTVDGFRGITLFDVAANNYVLTTGKTSNSNSWDLVGWTSTQLTDAGVTTAKEYQLHLIDQAAEATTARAASAQAARNHEAHSTWPR